MLYKVVEIWADIFNHDKPHVKKDIGCNWTTVQKAKNEMKTLKEKNPGMSYGLETKSNKS